MSEMSQVGYLAFKFENRYLGIKYE